MAADDTDTFGGRVRTARKAAGLSVEKLRDRVMTLVPARYVPGVKTFYRLESGEVDEASVDGILVVAIASVLNVRISRLSEAVAEEQERLGDLLASALPCIQTPTYRTDSDISVTVCEGQLPLLADEPDLVAA